MKITKQVRQVVLDALRTKKMERQELASRLGVSKSWVTKFFNGHIAYLKDETATEMEKALGVRFYRVVESARTHTELAERFAKLMDASPLVASAAVAIMELASHSSGAFTPPYLSPKELTKLGGVVTRIVHANDGKYGKIGRLVLEELAEFRDGEDIAKAAEDPSKYKS